MLCSELRELRSRIAEMHRTKDELGTRLNLFEQKQPNI